MRRTEQLQGLRMLKLRETLTRWESGHLSQLEAAEILGMSERTFRRWARRFEADGDTGLTDHRLGRRAGHAVPSEWEKEVTRLYRGRYKGLTAKHFHEYLARDHGFRWSYSWTKSFLQSAGLIEKAPRRGAHRRKRDRRPMAGMMLHQDASKHLWLHGLGELDLVVTMDDATSEIYSAILVEEEGTMSSFLGLAETIAAKGLFSSFYTDRGRHYFFTPEAGGKVSKEVMTQVGRALSQLNIKHIAAYSPEARGRSERAFRTIQDRLPKDFALAGIVGDVTAANRFLREVFVPLYNRLFAVKPELEESAFVPPGDLPWRDTLCIQEERVVAPDNTVSWNGRRLQIPAHPSRPHFVRVTVRVHEYPDGALAIFHGPRRLVHWTMKEAEDLPSAKPSRRGKA
jgi:transposase